jgi:hypothetical protein
MFISVVPLGCVSFIGAGSCKLRTSLKIVIAFSAALRGKTDLLGPAHERSKRGPGVGIAASDGSPASAPRTAGTSPIYDPARPRERNDLWPAQWTVAVRCLRPPCSGQQQARGRWSLPGRGSRSTRARAERIEQRLLSEIICKTFAHADFSLTCRDIVATRAQGVAGDPVRRSAFVALALAGERAWWYAFAASGIGGIEYSGG